MSITKRFAFIYRRVEWLYERKKESRCWKDFQVWYHMILSWLCDWPSNSITKCGVCVYLKKRGLSVFFFLPFQYIHAHAHPGNFEFRIEFADTFELHKIEAARTVLSNKLIFFFLWWSFFGYRDVRINVDLIFTRRRKGSIRSRRLYWNLEHVRGFTNYIFFLPMSLVGICILITCGKNLLLLFFRTDLISSFIFEWW